MLPVAWEASSKTASVEKNGRQVRHIPQSVLFSSSRNGAGAEIHWRQSSGLVQEKGVFPAQAVSLAIVGRDGSYFWRMFFSLGIVRDWFWIASRDNVLARLSSVALDGLTRIPSRQMSSILPLFSSEMCSLLSRCMYRDIRRRDRSGKIKTIEANSILVSFSPPTGSLSSQSERILSEKGRRIHRRSAAWGRAKGQRFQNSFEMNARISSSVLVLESDIAKCENKIDLATSSSSLARS